MDALAALLMFESLASSARLDAFRLLVRHHPDGLVAGAIATALDIPANTLSFHLKAMSHAGLVTATPEGRYLRYRANLDRMRAMVAFLTEECCGGAATCIDELPACCPEPEPR
jgi:DNA-binding transcriptional ArsR family regulator